MRCRGLLVSALIAAVGACSAEPELLARFGTGAGQNLSIAIDGSDVFAFYDVVYVIDLEAREVRDLGLAIGGSSYFQVVEASEGWAFWFAGPDWTTTPSITSVRGG